MKETIDDLVDDLEAVKSETDEVEQCKMLSKIFGDDFPIPEKKNAAQKTNEFYTFNKCIRSRLRCFHQKNSNESYRKVML